MVGQQVESLSPAREPLGAREARRCESIGDGLPCLHPAAWVVVVRGATCGLTTRDLMCDPHRWDPRWVTGRLGRTSVATRTASICSRAHRCDAPGRQAATSDDDQA